MPNSSPQKPFQAPAQLEAAYEQAFAQHKHLKTKAGPEVAGKRNCFGDLESACQPIFKTISEVADAYVSSCDLSGCNAAPGNLRSQAQKRWLTKVYLGLFLIAIVGLAIKYF